MGIPHISLLLYRVGRGSGVEPVPESITPTFSLSSLSSPRVGSLPDAGLFSCRRFPATQELSQHVVQDAAVAVVLDLLRSVEAHPGLELGHLAAIGLGADDHLAAVLETAPHSRGQARDVDHLLAGEPEARHGVAAREFQGSDAHADQVAAVDALE